MKVSVIIISYNEEQYVGQLLESLLKNTDQEFELVLADSTSLDNTYSILKKYAKKFLHAKVLQFPKKGASYARNRGASAATGEYLIFMDCDIIISENFIADVKKHIATSPQGCYGIYMKPYDGKFLDKIYYSSLNAWFWLTQKIYPHVVGSCMIGRKDVHKKLKGFDVEIKLAEDNDYACRARKVSSFAMMPISVSVSTRRFILEGHFKLGLKYIAALFYRIFVGEIKSDIFKYEFGHYKKI